MKKLIIFAALAGLSTPAMSAELLTNGNFETGTFTGWTTSVQSGSNGNLYVDTPGTTTPQSAQTTAANPAGGSFYAVTDQFGPGAYSLTQIFLVPLDSTSLSLSFQMFVNNYSTTFIDPAGLDYNGSPNQHARVDILTAGADPFSTAAGDIVANFYIGADLGANPNPYTDYLFDLSPLLTAGQTYQIRFGQVDNQSFFNLGFDNVSIQSNANNAVPEPGSWATMLLGFGVMGLSFRRRRKLSLA